MIKQFPSTFLSYTILLILGLIHPASAECDQCFFTSDDDADCLVYGKIDGRFVSYPRASQACLDAYEIKVAVVDPFSVGCDPINVNTFVNYGVKNGVLSNSVLAGLGIAEGGFFDEVDGMNVLKDSITVEGTTYDCEASSSDCYNAMKTYFATAAGMVEVNQVCTTIVNKVFLGKETEQNVLRDRLCLEKDEGATLDSACDNVAQSIQAKRDVEPDLPCQNFAFGTANSTVPGCKGKGPSLGGSNNNSTSSSMLLPYASVLGAFVVGWMVL